MGESMEPELHVATIEAIAPRTLHAIVKLRCDVFVVEQQCVYPELDGLDDQPTTRHLWITEAGQANRVLSYLRILQPETGGTWIGRIVTRPDQRRTGQGSRLVRTALGLLDDELVPEVHLNAQVYAAPWYEGFGFEACGAVFVEDGISHVPMRRFMPTTA